MTSRSPDHHIRNTGPQSILIIPFPLANSEVFPSASWLNPTRSYLISSNPRDEVYQSIRYSQVTPKLRIDIFPLPLCSPRIVPRPDRSVHQLLSSIRSPFSLEGLTMNTAKTSSPYSVPVS
jgi:hypothetical protein